MKECDSCGAVVGDDLASCPEDGGALRQTLEGPAVIGGRYLVLGRLGSGAMGHVYLARHLVLKREVALKLIAPSRRHDPVTLARFRTEAEALGRLHHPNVVQVLDYGVDDRGTGIPYLVMERLEGRTLAEVLAVNGRLPVSEALPVLSRVACALDHAHRNGVLHRDLKPANIFLCGGGGPEPEVKLLDLGLARLTQDVGRTMPPSSEPLPASARADETGAVQLTRAGLVVGTPLYLAPESSRGDESGPGADVYALGVVAYEVVTGSPPLDPMTARRRAADARVAIEPPSSRFPGLDPTLDAPLLAPLAHDPGSRPTSAGAFVAAVRAAHLAACRARWRRRELPRRAGLAAAVAAVAVPLGLSAARSEPLQAVERQVADLGVRLASPRTVDPRLLLVPFDETSLTADNRPLVELASDVGAMLGRLCDAGAAVVAVDILLPPRWGSDPSFVRAVIDHADRIVLAVSSTEDRVIGTGVADGAIPLALGPARTTGLFAKANVAADPDGLVRSVAIEVATADGGRSPTFAARVAQVLVGREPGEGPRIRPVDYRYDPATLERLSWADLAAALERAPGRFAGRAVLIGVAFVGAGDESHPIPHTEGTAARVSGVTLQALMVNSLVAEDALRPVRSGAILGTTALVGLAAAFLALWWPGWPAPAMGVVALAAAAATTQFLLGACDLRAPLAPVGAVVVFALVIGMILARWQPPRPAPHTED